MVLIYIIVTVTTITPVDISRSLPRRAQREREFSLRSDLDLESQQTVRTKLRTVGNKRMTGVSVPKSVDLLLLYLPSRIAYFR